MRKLQAIGFLLLFSAVAFAHDMGANFTITSGTNVWSLDSGATSITGVNYTWAFPDSGGLNMKPASTAYNVNNSATTNGFVLDLGGGAISGGGDLLTTSSANSPCGPIVVVNAGAVSIGNINTINTYGGENNAGAISITNAGSLSFSYSYSYGTVYQKYAGAQSFSGDNSGSFSVSGAMNSYCYARPGGDITIQKYSSVSVGGIIDTHQIGNGGERPGVITIGSTNSYIVGSVTVSGGLASWSESGNASPVYIYSGGDISVSMGINTHCTFSAGNGVSGNATLTSTNGAISVAGGFSGAGTGYNAYGANCTLKAKNSIAVSGVIDLTGYAGRYGTFFLTNSSATATIQVGDLDLSKVAYASFCSGSGAGTLTNYLASFATGYSSGTGTSVDPYVTTQKVLRIPSGTTLLYSTTTNAYLGGKYYKLASLAGTAGTGGVLGPASTPAGMTVYVVGYFFGISNKTIQQVDDETALSFLFNKLAPLYMGDMRNVPWETIP